MHLITTHLFIFWGAIDGKQQPILPRVASESVRKTGTDIVSVYICAKCFMEALNHGLFV